MIDQNEDADIDALENEPAFICSQLQVGETLTQREVVAIQAILSELDKRENEDVNNFGDGREYGIKEIGGEELLAAVKAKDDAYITKVVRETIAKMEARTAEIKAATLPEPETETPSPQSNVVGLDPVTIEACARLIEGSVILDTHEGKTLKPREEGNREGLHYAAAIRELGLNHGCKINSHPEYVTSEGGR